MSAILALDTSTDACSVALAVNDEVTEKVSLAPREHTKYILPMIEELLASAGFTLGQLDAIAFGRGPGSFTGLRIGLSVAQGLAYGRDLPLIGISTLHAMANQAKRTKDLAENSLFFPVLDARMNEVYACAYQAKQGELKPLLDEQVLKPQHLVKLIHESQMIQGSIIGVGSGWRYSELTSVNCAHQDINFYPSAYDVAELAMPAYDRGELIDSLQVEPRYLRNEISWKKRSRIRS